MKTDRHGNECSKQVDLTIVTLTSLEFDYSAARTNCEQLYGSNGIYVNVLSERCVALTDEQTLQLDIIDGTCRWNQFSAEQDDLYDAVGANSFSGVLVAFVGGLKKPDGGTLNGCSGHEPAKPTAVIAKNATVWTMAHELGHILLSPTFSPVHTDQSDNIMYRRSSSFTSSSNPTINAAQRTQMLTSQYLKAC